MSVHSAQNSSLHSSDNTHPSNVEALINSLTCISESCKNALKIEFPLAQFLRLQELIFFFRNDD